MWSIRPDTHVFLCLTVLFLGGGGGGIDGFHQVRLPDMAVFFFFLTGGTRPEQVCVCVDLA